MKYTDVEVDAHERGIVIWIKSRSTRIHLSGSIFAEPHAWLTREVGAGIPADYYVTGDAEGERKSTGLFDGNQAGSLTVKSVVDHASAVQTERMTVDEAMTYSDSFDPATIDRGGSIQEAFLELAAEVRRLRVENAEQKAIYEGLCK